MRLFFPATYFGDNRDPERARHPALTSAQLVGLILGILLLAALIGGVILGLRSVPLADCPNPTNAACGYR